MKLYSYNGTGESREEVSGLVAEVTRRRAVERLADRGVAAATLVREPVLCPWRKPRKPGTWTTLWQCYTVLAECAQAGRTASESLAVLRAASTNTSFVRSLDRLSKRFGKDLAFDHFGHLAPPELAPTYEALMKNADGNAECARRIRQFANGCLLRSSIRTAGATPDSWRLVPVALLAFGLFGYAAVVALEGFRDIFTTFGAVLPVSTVLVLAMAQLLGFFYTREGLGLTLIVLLFICWLYVRPAGAAFFDALRWQVPFLSRHHRQTVRSELLLDLSIAAEGGAPAPVVFQCAAAPCDNAWIRDRLNRAARSVRAGTSFVAALQTNGLLTNTQVWKLDEVLHKTDLADALRKVATCEIEHVGLEAQSLSTALATAAFGAMFFLLFFGWGLFAPILSLSGIVQ